LWHRRETAAVSALCTSARRDCRSDSECRQQYECRAVPKRVEQVAVLAVVSGRFVAGDAADRLRRRRFDKWPAADSLAANKLGAGDRAALRKSRVEIAETRSSHKASCVHGIIAS
jgi:hypothetical protein